MKTMDVVAATLLVGGGLNCDLVGILGFDLVAAIFGDPSALSRIIYSLVGLGALYQAMQWKAIQGLIAGAGTVAEEVSIQKSHSEGGNK